jgi:subtilisin family serine protease
MKERWPRLLIFLILFLGCVFWLGTFSATAEVAGMADGTEYNKSIQVVKGPRPPVDLNKVTSDAYEPGKLHIKLKVDLADVVPEKPIHAGPAGYVITGQSNLDALNRTFAVKLYNPLFAGLYTDARSLQYRARHQAWGFHLWFELIVPKDTDILTAVRQFQALDEVEIASPEFKKQLIRDVPAAPADNVSAFPELRWTPNDPRFAEQWHYHNTGQQGGTPGADIRLPAAWDIEKGHSEVIVAVIDGGIDYNHQDLADNMWDGIGWNFVNNSSTIIPHNHGTHVAGTVAAVNHNAIGVAGVAGGSGSGDGVRLMSCQVFTDSGYGGFHTAPVWAADRDAAISQNSWGYSSPGVYDQPELDAIDYFNEHGGGDALDGGITIFAAGNDNDDGEWYPGYYEGAFSVAATNNQDQRSYYSNYGDWIDISAPGGEMSFCGDPRGVLSTLNNNTYGFYQGTSMACPHASGVAALIVSLGYGQLDAEAVAEILRDTTDDHYAVNPDYQGKLGTGRLNALAALEETQSRLGPDGTLTGTVTTGGTPLANATITAQGPVTHSTSTNVSGTYILDNLSVGNYTVTATRHGYYPQTVTNVAIQEDQTTTLNFALNPAPMRQVSGRVADGATGWPLYASIDIAGYPDGMTWTDPVTGQYSVNLPDGGTYAFAVDAFVDGYETLERSVGPISGPRTENFELTADMTACSAPGYFAHAYLEDFESDNGGYTPSGSSADLWQWGVPVTWPGGCASGDKCWGTNLNGNYPNNASSVLTSPSINLSGVSGLLEATWWQALHMEFSVYDMAYAEVSINGGGWTVMWEHTGGTSQTDWTQRSYDISAAAGGTVQFRFRITTDSSVVYNGYYIDQVAIGSCGVPSGGIVVGNVFDANVSSPLVGAVVEGPTGLRAIAQATPDDAARPDAFYTLYSEAGTRSFTASFTGYGNTVHSVAVPAGGTIRRNFQLQAGRIEANPDSLAVTVQLGASTTRNLTIRNTGGTSLDWEISKGGPAQSASVSISPFTGQLPESGYPVSFEQAPRTPSTLSIPAVQSIAMLTGAPAFAVADLLDTNLVSIPNADVPGIWNIIAGVPDTLYAGDFAGSDFSQLFAIDNNTRRLLSINTTSGAVTDIGPCNPLSGQTWTGMSWDSSTETMFASATDGTTATLFILDLDTGAATRVGTITGAPATIDIAVNASGEMYAVDIFENALFQIDPFTGAATHVGTLGFDANFAQSMDFEEESGTLYWAAFGRERGSGQMRIIDTSTGASQLVGSFPGGTEVDCLAFATGGGPIAPWLSANPESGVVAAGGNQTVTVTFDASVEEITEPGVYQASLRIQNTTPYGVVVVPVQMTVNERHTVAVSASPADAGTVSGGGEYDYGTEATVTAEAATGWSFVNWTEDGQVVSTDAAYTFTVTADRNLVAHFSLNTHTINLSASPADAGTVSGGGEFGYGTVVTVEAIENQGWTFMNWTEGNRIVSCDARYSFRLNSNRTLRANFSQVRSTYNITGTARPVNYGSVTGSGVYNHGAIVTMTALPNQGFALTNWIETWPGLAGYCVVSNDERYTFPANRNRELTAKIRPKALPGVLMLLLDDE